MKLWKGKSAQRQDFGSTKRLDIDFKLRIGWFVFDFKDTILEQQSPVDGEVNFHYKDSNLEYNIWLDTKGKFRYFIMKFLIPSEDKELDWKGQIRNSINEPIKIHEEKIAVLSTCNTLDEHAIACYTCKKTEAQIELTGFKIVGNLCQGINGVPLPQKIPFQLEIVTHVPIPVLGIKKQNLTNYGLKQTQLERV